MANFTEKNRKILWIGLSFLFILAIFLHRFSTYRWGVGVSHDSIFYISAAENFLKGKGLSWVSGGNILKPLVHYPPLYPLSLSFLKLILGETLQAATWGAALFFGLNGLLVASFIHLGTGSTWASLAGGLLASLSPIFLDIHLQAMSEPLFLFIAFSSLGLIVIYLSKKKFWIYLLASIIASFAFLTRYIGISVIFTAAIALFVHYRGSFKQKIIHILPFCIIAILPNGFWYLRNFIHTGTFTNRVILFHPITPAQIKEGLISISSWIFPGTSPLGVRTTIMIVVAVMILVGTILFIFHLKLEIKQGNISRKSSATLILVLYGFIYSSLLFFSINFIDFSTHLNQRILIPLFFSILILLFLSLDQISGRFLGRSRTLFLIGSAGFLMVTCTTYVVQDIDLIRRFQEEGSGFSGMAWMNSEVIHVLQDLDPDPTVYTNEAFAVYYLTGVGAYSIPEKMDPVKNEVRENFLSAMEEMRESLRKPNSVLVLFHPYQLRPGMPTLEEITRGVVIAHGGNDGVIYLDPKNLNEWDAPAPNHP